MDKSKHNIAHIDFLEELMEKILNENLRLIKIMDIAKSKGIKGLTNDKIRDILLEKGIQFDSQSKRWIKSLRFEDNPSSEVTDSNLLVDNDETVILTKETLQSPEVREILDSIPPKTPDKTNAKSSQKSSKKIEDLFVKITNQEVIVQELLRKVSEIEGQLRDKIEESSIRDSSKDSINLFNFVELSYSNGRRYEVTLREDLVNKATEKLKNRYNLEAIDLTKLSHLFEIILFDYINSAE